MLNRLSVATLNHLLAQQPDLPRRLQAMTGKVARLLLPPHDIRFVIGDDGLLSASEQEARFTLSIPLYRWFRACSRTIRPHSTISHISGESEVAAELGQVLMQLRWDATEDLSRLVAISPPTGYRKSVSLIRLTRGQWLKTSRKPGRTLDRRTATDCAQDADSAIHQ